MSMLLMSSCASRDRITYFQNPEPVVEVIAEQPIRVQPGDKLIIVVKSKDAAVSDLFNLPIYTNRVGAQGASINATGATSQLYRVSQSEGVTAYNVTPQGTIDFPFLGDIKVEGMTRAELGAYIKGELVGRDLVKDPTVSVEFLNTGVNVLGAVTSPGRYEINTDNYTILDAIAVAGDLVLQGRRDNVKVVREEEGKMHVYTVDLTDLNKTMNSPVYYLRQNDVVYVAPSEELKRSANVNGNNIFSVSFWMSFASLLTTAATTVGVFVKK
ncbi:MAG: polysaccharide biosynthesis/export family protein [Muribaculaceae bacterium]|nr:polysaccharide biosynthesis/export family protein [Muribaculaceae bacterium]